MNRITTFFAKLFGTHTVDSVIGAVHSAIAKLESVRDHHFSLSLVYAQAADTAKAAQDAARAEAEKAAKVVQRIKALVA